MSSLSGEQPPIPSGHGGRAASVLEVWTFGSARQAQQSQRAYEGGHPSLPRVDDLAVVSWPPERPKPLTWQVPGRGSPRELSGAFWGLLFATVFLLPGTRAAGAPPEEVVAGDGCLAHLGIPAAFLAGVRLRVVPGTSALFVLRPAPDHDSFAAAREDREPTFVAVLDEDQDRRLRAGFADPDG